MPPQCCTQQFFRHAYHKAPRWMLQEQDKVPPQCCLCPVPGGALKPAEDDMHTPYVMLTTKFPAGCCRSRTRCPRSAACALSRGAL